MVMLFPRLRLMMEPINKRNIFYKNLTDEELEELNVLLALKFSRKNGELTSDEQSRLEVLCSKIEDK